MSDILEAARRALACLPGDDELHRDLALRVLTAVAPLIRAAALEQATQVVENYDTTGLTTVYELQCGIAAAIRFLKEQP
jgi:hypothetical protein